MWGIIFIWGTFVLRGTFFLVDFLCGVQFFFAGYNLLLFFVGDVAPPDFGGKFSIRG